MPVKVFIFDLDGVITDTAAFHMLAWKQLTDKLGLVFNEKVNEQLKGISRMESLEVILRHNNKEAQYTKEEKVNLANVKNSYYQKLISTITENDFLPGIKSLLIEIKANRYKLALASASLNALKILKSLKADKYFDYIVDPESIKFGKPAPDIFLQVANYFTFDPNDCIGLEDSKSGIEAINRAGMFSIGVGNKILLSEARLNVENTLQLKLDYILNAFNEYQTHKELAF